MGQKGMGGGMFSRAIIRFIALFPRLARSSIFVWGVKLFHNLVLSIYHLVFFFLVYLQIVSVDLERSAGHKNRENCRL